MNKDKRKTELNVLFAENDAVTHYSLPHVLREENMKVCKVKSGEHALKELKNSQFDLCVFNTHLPDISGLELLSITKDQSPASIVIIMSNSFSDESMKRAINGGAEKYLIKPIAPSYFRELVYHLLEQKEMQGNSTDMGKRMYRRKSLESQISFRLNLKSKDEEGHWFLGARWFLKGKVVDRSLGGLGLLTEFPLEVKQVLLFEERFDNQAGIVRWRTKVDENTFKVGVSFI